MAASRETTVRRVDWYLGPSTEIMPEALNDYRDHKKLGDWYIEPKLDGMWAMLIVGDPSEGIPNVLKSRDARTPEVTGSKAGDIPNLQIPLPQGTILVGELESATQWATEQFQKNGYRKFYVFDIPRIGEDNDLRTKSYRQRRIILEREIRLLHQSGGKKVSNRIKLVPNYDRTFNFLGLYKEWVEKGYEGAVLKRGDTLYQTKRLDGKTDLWLRCKKFVTEDYVLCGLPMTPGGKFSEPKVTGAWALRVNGELKEVLKATAPPEVLQKKNVGKLVAEFRGWERFKSGSIRHAQFVRVRKDKAPEDCTGPFGR